MRTILFDNPLAAKELIDSINFYVGSTVIAEIQNTDEPDLPYAVLVPVISTTVRTIDLPSMIADKKLVVPVEEVIKYPPDSSGTLS